MLYFIWSSWMWAGNVRYVHTLTHIPHPYIESMAHQHWFILAIFKSKLTYLSKPKLPYYRFHTHSFQILMFIWFDLFQSIFFCLQIGIVSISNYGNIFRTVSIVIYFSDNFNIQHVMMLGFAVWRIEFVIGE